MTEQLKAEQERLKAEYEKQMTHEGQFAIQVKRDLLRRYKAVVPFMPQRVGRVEPLYDAQTGEIMQYFIAE